MNCPGIRCLVQTPTLANCCAHTGLLEMLAQAPTPVPRMRVLWGEGGHLLWLGESGTGGGDRELGSSAELEARGLCHLFRLLHSLAASLSAALVGTLVFISGFIAMGTNTP